MTEAVLSARGLVRRHGRGAGARPVVDGVDLDVLPGELVAVVGRSGSGKSTLLHLLGGLDRPTAGEVRLLGAPLHGRSERRLAALRARGIGFVFQAFHLVPELSAWENALLPARVARDAAAGRTRLHALFERLELAGLERRLPIDLSGGEQQRVAVARALVMDPPLILADEPTGNLDERAGDEVMALLRAAVDARRAVVVVTHDDRHAAGADRVLTLRDGRLAGDEAGVADAA